MSNKLIDESQPIAEINIIPFVDIILVILIIFMVTAPFIIKSGFSLDLPKASSAGAVSPAKVNITISADGRVLLNGELLEPDQMVKKLKKDNPKPEQTHVVISADKNILHGKVISVINIVQSAGLRKVAIATKKSK